MEANINFDQFSLSPLPTFLTLTTLMARRITCITCGQEFTEAKYHIHKFTHLRDKFLQKPPSDPLASRLLPIEVSDEDIAMVEDTPDSPAQSSDHDNPPDDHKTAGNSLQPNNPFSDDYAMDNNIPLHGTPFVDPPHPLLSSLLSDENMDTSLSPGHSEDDLGQDLASIQSSLDDEDIEFEDSGLDPTSTGYPSLSEQLKEQLLRDYHGGGKLYQNKCLCICSPLRANSKAPN